MHRAGLLARASTALCSGILNNVGRAGDCMASTSYAQSLPRTAGWQHQPHRPSTALTTTSSNVAAVTKSLLVDTLTLVSSCSCSLRVIHCAGLRWCSNPLPAAAQMRRFEKQGMTREQAEALTEHMTELICTNREKIVEQFVSKAALEKVVALQGCLYWLYDRWHA